jgi:hypothetical protein
MRSYAEPRRAPQQRVTPASRGPRSSPIRVQLKLSVGSPQSPLEREADQVAAALVAPERRPTRPPCVGCSQELQRQPTEDVFQISEEDEERDRAVGTIQTKQALGGGAATTPGIEGRLSDLRGNGRRLPAAVRASFEPASAMTSPTSGCTPTRARTRSREPCTPGRSPGATRSPSAQGSTSPISRPAAGCSRTSWRM